LRAGLAGVRLLLDFGLRPDVPDPAQDASTAPARVACAERIAFAKEGLSGDAVDLGEDLEVRLFVRCGRVHDVVRGAGQIAECRVRLGAKEVKEPYDSSVTRRVRAIDAARHDGENVVRSTCAK
jgi:hypothetical protein